MTNLEKLLMRWSQLEPYRCFFDEKNGDLLVMLRGNFKKALTFIGEPDYERIIGAVIEAAEAREWCLSMESFIMGERIREAAVWSPSIIERKGKGNSLAEAFVDAYLKALEDFLEFGELED